MKVPRRPLREQSALSPVLTVLSLNPTNDLFSISYNLGDTDLIVSLQATDAKARISD